MNEEISGFSVPDENQLELTEEQKIQLEKLKKLYEKEQPVYSKTPIHKKSSCDVYKNNKYFLARMSIYYDMGDFDTIRASMGVSTREEADKLFEESNGTLPFKRYATLKKIYNSFALAFDEKIVI